MTEEWKEVKLGDITKVFSGYAFKSSIFNSENATVPTIKIKNIKNGTVDISNSDFVDQSFLTINSKYHISRNDILISLTGSHMTQPNSVVGRVALYRIDQTALLNQRAGKIAPNESEIDRLFLYALLSQDFIKEKFALRAKGAANQANISPSDIEDIKIRIPSLSVQHKIASILSAYDDLIENNLRRIKLLEELAQQTYEEWFVKFTVNGEKLKIDKHTGLPEGWKKKKFKDILNFKTGKLDSNAMDANGSYNFYTCSKEIYKTNTFCFNGEAVLLGGNNATGDFSLFYANEKFDAYQRTYIVTTKDETYPLVYVYYVLMSYLSYFKNVSSGAATKFLTIKTINATTIILPTKNIIEKYNKTIRPCFDQIINLKKQNDYLKETRDLSLAKLMKK